MDNSGPTITDIRLVAKTTIALLAGAGYSCCLVGSAAGYEHGITRVPNDIDILVMSEKDHQELKCYLVSADPSFYWAKSTTNPKASYRVLWCRLPAPDIVPTTGKSCRIDLFTPGMIHLPRIPSDRIVQSAPGLPIMPFFPTVLHKIQAWKAHLASSKPWAVVKHSNDVNDINDLLRAALTIDESLQNQAWLDAWFIEEAIAGVQEYVLQHPETTQGWNKLGFFDTTWNKNGPPEQDAARNS